MKLECYAVEIENIMFTAGKIYTAYSPRNALPDSRLVQVNDDMGRLRMLLLEGSDNSAAFIVHNDAGNPRLPEVMRKPLHAYFCQVPEE